MDELIFVTNLNPYNLSEVQMRTRINVENLTNLDRWTKKLQGEIAEDAKIVIICCAGTGTRKLANAIANIFPLSVIHNEDIDFSYAELTVEDPEKIKGLERVIDEQGKDAYAVMVVTSCLGQHIPRDFWKIAEKVGMNAIKETHDSDHLSWRTITKD